MSTGWSDWVGGVTPPEEMSDEALIYAADMGDERAAAELRRRIDVSVWGPQATQIGSASDVSDETLLTRMSAGDQAAQEEWFKRHPLPSG